MCNIFHIPKFRRKKKNLKIKSCGGDRGKKPPTPYLSRGSSIQGQEFQLIPNSRLNFWFGCLNLSSKFIDFTFYSLIMASIVATLPPPLLAPRKSFTILNISQKLSVLSTASKFITRFYPIILLNLSSVEIDVRSIVFIFELHFL